MNSSMLAGERRWASARRGGMTVLGKVSVPKPLNLPSQRLENHGLDPNVEIVPKGTLCWGSRPSSSGSNAWVSSASNADGGTTSPSHLSGRPSSAGSGTRPSTGGSDGTYEPANAWVSNSRPSSASGTLTSSQTSLASLRPKSAETRPNSSQRSRFAEPLSEGSVAWGTNSTAERLGAKSLKDKEFSLSSVDFPTLGTEKETSAVNTELQDHGRPSSSSGRMVQVQAKEDMMFHSESQCGVTDNLRTENDIYSKVEKWRGEPQQYFNTKSPQHMDAWHGPPMNAPPGPWYRGYPVRPAFGAPLAPGDFPREPFPYYQPQIPPPAIGGAVPPPGPGPRRPPSKNGGLYRPQAAGAYASPGMPCRPGFYPGPSGPPGPMNFEGYYGPPMNYYNNERDFTFAGMSAGPAFYNGYPPPGAPNLASSIGRASGHGSGEKMLSESVEANHKGQLRVSKMNRNDWERKGEGENWEQDIQSNALDPGKSSLLIATSRKDEWGAEEYVDEGIFSKRKMPSDCSVNNIEYQRHTTESVRMKSFENMGSVGGVDGNWTSTSQIVTFFSPETSQPPLASERNSSLPTATNIAGLNVKLGVTDGQYDAVVTCKEWRSEPEVEMNTSISSKGVLVSQDLTPVPHQAARPVQNKSTNQTPPLSSTHHGAQDKVDDYGKGKINSKDAIICAIIPPPELSDVTVSSAVESTLNNHRGKMKELAKQRARQLQKEEEERTREQKAKAFAKLEELNRRTQAGEAVDQKSENTRIISDMEQEQDEAFAQESVLVDQKTHTHCQKLNFDHNDTPLEKDDTNSLSGKSVEEFKSCSFETSRTCQSESNQSYEQSLAMKKDDHNASARKVATELNDKGIFRHDQEGYKPNQSNSLLKGLNEMSVENVTCGAPIDLLNIGSNVISIEAGSSQIKSSGLSYAPNTYSTGIKPSIQQMRKSNSSKNKQKVDESQVFPISSPVQSYSDMAKETIENAESNVYFPNLGGSVVSVADPDRGIQAAVELSTLLSEEAHSRSTNQRKHHPSRRMPRNHQSNKVMGKSHGSDAVFWAPVHAQNNTDSGTEADKKLSLETTMNTNSDNTTPNISKGKRAEMERYVPKPVAKGLAQQEKIPTVPFSTNSPTSYETPGKEQSGSIGSSSLQHVTPFVGSSVEIKEGDGKHNKHKKEQGTWRQRGSSHMKGVPFESPRISEPTDDHKSMKFVKNSSNPEIITPRGIDSSVCMNSSSNTQLGKTLVRDEGAAALGNQHPSKTPHHLSKVPQSTGKYDDGGILTGESETDGHSTMFAVPDIGVAERTAASKNNRSLGERQSSHWQPKSNSRSASNLHGNKTAGSETVTMEINKSLKQDNPSPRKVQVSLQHEKKILDAYQPHTSQSFSEVGVSRESTMGNHLDINREKKPLLDKEVSHPPNQDAITSIESASINTYVQQERNAPTGSGTNCKQNNRSFRSHEAQGDWSSGQSDRRTNMARERHRQNSRYEYRPYKNNKSENIDEQTDGVNPSLAYGGRGHGRTKHGGKLFQ